MADTPTPAAQAVEAVEAKTGMVPEAAPKAEPADPRFEALARKERQLQRMRKDLEAERSALQTKQKDYETGYIPKQRLTEDPFGTLNELGLTYDKLTEMLLETPNMNDPAIRALQNKIRALEEKQNQAVKMQEEAATRQYQDAIKQITSEVKQLVDTSADFEMVKTTGLHEAVVELIEQTYNKDGYLMDIQEAAKQVEEHLLEEAEKLANTGKVKSRLQSKAQPASEPNQPEQQQSGIKTLTNAVGAKPAPKNRLSEKERIARAMAAFSGKLNE